MAKIKWTEQDGSHICENEDNGHKVTITKDLRVVVDIKGVPHELLTINGEEINIEVLKMPIEPLVISWGTFMSTFDSSPASAEKKFNNALEFCTNCCKSLGMDVTSHKPPMYKLLWDKAKGVRGVCEVFGQIGTTMHDICAIAITEQASASRMVNYHEAGKPMSMDGQTMAEYMDKNFCSLAVITKKQGKEYWLYSNRVRKTMKFVNGDDVTFKLYNELKPNIMDNAEELFLLA